MRVSSAAIDASACLGSGVCASNIHLLTSESVLRLDGIVWIGVCWFFSDMKKRPAWLRKAFTHRRSSWSAGLTADLSENSIEYWTKPCIAMKMASMGSSLRWGRNRNIRVVNFLRFTLAGLEFKNWQS